MLTLPTVEFPIMSLPANHGVLELSCVSAQSGLGWHQPPPPHHASPPASWHYMRGEGVLYGSLAARLSNHSILAAARALEPGDPRAGNKPAQPGEKPNSVTEWCVCVSVARALDVRPVSCVCVSVEFVS